MARYDSVDEEWVSGGSERRSCPICARLLDGDKVNVLSFRRGWREREEVPE